MINSVTVCGNLTRDAELTYTQGGTPVLKVGIAVNERVKDGDEWTDRANFFDAVMYGNRAEKLAAHLSKGNKVGITGKLRQERWQAQDGGNRSRVVIIVDDFEFMAAKADKHTQPAQQYNDTDIPF